MELDGLIQGAGEVAIGNEVGGFGAGHLDAGAHNDAGQSHAADGGPEQFTFRVVGGAFRFEVENPAIGDQQIHGDHMIAEGTR